MIHYSCDRCRRLIETEHELRYVVRIEVEATLGDEALENNDEKDSLFELEEIIDRQDEPLDSFSNNDVFKPKRYDLCSECHAAFAQNPLGRETSKPVGFSDN